MSKNHCWAFESASLLVLDEPLLRGFRRLANVDTRKPGIFARAGFIGKLDYVHRINAL